MSWKFYSKTISQSPQLFKLCLYLYNIRAMLINYKQFMLVAQLDSSVDNVYEQYKNKFNFFFCLNQILPHTSVIATLTFSSSLSLIFLSPPLSLSVCVSLSGLFVYSVVYNEVPQ